MSFLLINYISGDLIINPRNVKIIKLVNSLNYILISMNWNLVN